MMHGSGCACCSVKAGVSELSRAELEAFVAQGRGICPHAWVRVEHLQRLCREAMPATTSPSDSHVRSCTSLPRYAEHRLHQSSILPPASCLSQTTAGRAKC